MPIWPGGPAIDVKQVSSINLGDKFNLSRLELGTHTLTHVNAPRHFIEQGLPVDRLPLDTRIGPAVVVEPGSEDNLITAGDLGQLGLHNVDRLLIKTGNSNLWARERREFEINSSVSL
jgi:arylformamidase